MELEKKENKLNKEFNRLIKLLDQAKTKIEREKILAEINNILFQMRNCLLLMDYQDKTNTVLKQAGLTPISFDSAEHQIEQISPTDDESLKL